MTDSLITDLEAAAEGSRELDARIAEEVGWCFVPEHSLSEARWLPPEWSDPKTEPDFDDPPPYSTSIDAAITLIPKGCGWSINEDRDQCQALIFRGGDGVVGRGDAAKPALAFSAASLRAMKETDDE